jgi:pimeloyl-ACP methyl ester carboxylesterase
VQPETRYADSGGVNIAYQVLGDGPRDLVFVMGWVSNIEVFWEEPTLARFLTRLASFSRLILFDKRGTGLSDRVTDLPSLEVRMDDVRAVMDAVGSERAALFGVSEGGPMSALFSATYPSRVSALIMQGGFPRRIRTPDFPWDRLKKSAKCGSSRCDANGAEPSASPRARPAWSGTNDSRSGGAGCSEWARVPRR